MKGSMSTDLGIITINPEVIAKYAGSMAIECFGIVGMAAVNMKDGLVHLLKRESLTRGIHVEITEDNVITLDFHVIVSYGVSISAVADNYRVALLPALSQHKLYVATYPGLAVKAVTERVCHIVYADTRLQRLEIYPVVTRSHILMPLRVTWRPCGLCRQSPIRSACGWCFRERRASHGRR